jgi:hypothetical protein
LNRSEYRGGTLQAPAVLTIGFVAHTRTKTTAALQDCGASTPELRQPIVALSLGGLRRRIEIALLPDNVRIVLQLDGLAERERHRRRAQAQLTR